MEELGGGYAPPCPPPLGGNACGNLKGFPPCDSTAGESLFFWGIMDRCYSLPGAKNRQAPRAYFRFPGIVLAHARSLMDTSLSSLRATLFYQRGRCINLVFQVGRIGARSIHFTGDCIGIFTFTCSKHIAIFGIFHNISPFIGSFASKHEPIIRKYRVLYI